MSKINPFFPKNGNWYSPIYQFEIDKNDLLNGHDVVGFDGNVVRVYSTPETYTVETPGGAITTDLVVLAK